MQFNYQLYKVRNLRIRWLPSNIKRSSRETSSEKTTFEEKMSCDKRTKDFWRENTYQLEEVLFTRKGYHEL